VELSRNRLQQRASLARDEHASFVLPLITRWLDQRYDVSRDEPNETACFKVLPESAR